MNSLNRFASIRVRLTLWHTFFLALIILGFSVYLHFQLEDGLSIQIDEGLQVAASHLLVDVNDAVNPPVLTPMSEEAEEYLAQSSFALRLVNADGTVAADVGGFPALPFTPSKVQTFETVIIDHVPWRIFTRQVETQTTRFDVWLQMGQSLDIVQNTQSNLTRLILFGLPAALVIAAFGGIFTANRALNPVDTITRTVQSISGAKMTERVPYHGVDDELGRLTKMLNLMLDRVESAFEAERRFTADASHELRTPLTAIKGEIDVTLTRQRTPEEYEKALHHIQKESDRLIRLANDLLFLARLDNTLLPKTLEPVNLSDLLEAVIEQFRGLAEEKAVVITADVPPNLVIHAMADQLIRLFLNLIDNAVKYTPAGGSIKIAVTHDKRSISVGITDTGPGIAPEHIPHLFERFYRVDSDRTSRSGGTGLGLAIADQIARAHQGIIHVESAPMQGSTFIVRLPLSGAAEA